MNVDTLLGNFEVLAEAPDGIEKLRELILRLAAEGLLIDPSLSENEIVELIASNNKSANKPELKSFCNSRGKVVYEIQIADAADLVQQAQSKIKTNQIKPSGAHPVVDQGQQFIAGFIDGIAPINASDNAVLVFGDHTRNIKYIDFDFVVGADGVKVLRTKYLDPKFFYYMARSINLPSRGYGRHYRAFCSSYIPIFSQTEQMMTVSTIEKLMALCDQLEQQQKHRDNLRTATRKSAIDAISTATTPEELEIAWKRMNNNWEVIADTPESVESLRELILDLAVRGDLGITDISAANAPTLWDVEEQKLDADKLWKLDTMHVNPANGWNRLPLARLGTWGSGGTPTASRKEFYNNGSIPWAVIGDLNNGVMTDTSSKITQKALASSSAKLIPKNAVLIAMYGASIGKTAVTGIECTTNQAIAHCIVDESVVSTEYFFLVAKSLKKHLIKVGKGAAQPNISQTVLKHLLIDVPQLNAQQIVVAKVNEFMALCDQLESELESRSEVAEKFARSVVSAS